MPKRACVTAVLATWITFALFSFRFGWVALLRIVL